MVVGKVVVEKKAWRRDYQLKLVRGRTLENGFGAGFQPPDNLFRVFSGGLGPPAVELKLFVGIAHALNQRKEQPEQKQRLRLKRQQHVWKVSRRTGLTRSQDWKTEIQIICSAAWAITWANIDDWSFTMNATSGHVRRKLARNWTQHWNNFTRVKFPAWEQVF